MLEAHEFFIGALGNAQPGSLMLPRSEYEAVFLIGTMRNVPTGVVLAGQYAYRTVPTAESANWRGMIIPDVSVVVDPFSLVDPAQEDIPLGAAIRMGDRLMIKALDDNGGFGAQPTSLDVATGLPGGDSSSRGAFLHWQVVLGQGTDRRILFDLDLYQRALIRTHVPTVAVRAT